MRLVDTLSLDVVEVPADAIPRYAILSHTWSNDEVTLQDIREVNGRQWSQAVSQKGSAIKKKTGYNKLRRAAAIAAENNYQYLWIDTCCIDKTSSAELSEAINSMYRWYQSASICYAYLSDVHFGYENGQFGVKWSGSRWFARGWTLQELIAPANVLFYGADWEYIGSKAQDEDIRVALSDITGIDIRILEGVTQTSEISVATRMKWASKRETTRIEDMAYCLLGIFDINMPLLYGEGSKAFIRLQEEILKVSDDHSIFAWSRTPNTTSDLHGLLAESPRKFEHVANYTPLPPIASRGSEAWSTTNQGLRLPLFLRRSDTNKNSPHNDYLAILECSIRREDGEFWSPAIRLRRLYGDQFARTSPDKLLTVPSAWLEEESNGSHEVVFVKQQPVYATPHIMIAFENIISSRPTDHPCYIEAVWPRRYWDDLTALFKPTLTSANRIVGVFRFRHSWSKIAIDLAVGLHTDSDGAWTCQAMQRSSAGSIISALSSANDFVARCGYPSTANPSLPEVITRSSNLPLKREVTTDWFSRPWRPLDQTYILQARIDASKKHGRLYYVIHVTLLPELDTTVHTVTLRDSNPVTDQSVTEINLQRMLKSLTPIESLIPYYLDLSGLPSSIVDMNEEGYDLLKISEGPQVQFNFQQACYAGNLAKVESLLAEHKPPLLPDWLFEAATEGYSGYRPLHWAALKGRIKIVKRLLSAGALIDSRTEQGWTPIHLAALRGRFATMEVLIDYALESGLADNMESDFFDDRKNKWQESPLHLAVGHSQQTLDEVDRNAFLRIMHRFYESSLWASGNFKNETPLHRAALVGHETLVSHLDFEKNFRYPGKYLDGLGRTVLWIASRARIHSAVERLLTKSGRPIPEHDLLCNISDYYGLSPLHAACRVGDATTVRTLLKAGADPNAVTSPPCLTAAHIAALYGHRNCLSALIQANSAVDRSLQCDDENMHCTPFHLAFWNKHYICVQMLDIALSGTHDLPCTHWIRQEDGQLLKSQKVDKQ